MNIQSKYDLINPNIIQSISITGARIGRGRMGAERQDCD